MSRAFYISDVKRFVVQPDDSILGEMTKKNPFALEDLQRNAWIEEIQILKTVFTEMDRGDIIFEYTIPRIGKRIDAVYIVDGLIFLLEFKIGAYEYSKSAINQVIDYALDLKNFHKESHRRLLIPMLIATEAPDSAFHSQKMKEGILDVLQCNKNNIVHAFQYILSKFSAKDMDTNDWIYSPYAPTPTIIEAAQALYRGHKVSDISRNDASAFNLNETTMAINTIIEKSKNECRKSICFITGVPGAGKTLAGLNIANERHRFDKEEHAIFLSGNQPLVDVLQEALARDEHLRTNVKKTEALAKAKAFIQNIHHFRDDAISTYTAPNEKVAIFDEAQRAWTKDMLADFMKRKKGRADFFMSEPEFLISIMDRHEDWAVIICLVGGGQEINTGEAGLIEWFDAIRKGFSRWDVYVSEQITDSEYTRNLSIKQLFHDLRYSVVDALHLAVSLRSFRSENVSALIKAILDVEKENAKALYHSLSNDYPILLTRDLKKAKAWVRSHAKGTERYGIVASSGAKRLRPFGVWVQSKIDAVTWFLNDAEDVRSSYFLEDTATEFDIQGLELDWTIVCWDANLRLSNNHFQYYRFIGSKWQNIKNQENILYLKNAYRVLLTRARQGMIIFVPEGNKEDITRLPAYYDGIYQFFIEIGLREI